MLRQAKEKFKFMLLLLCLVVGGATGVEASLSGDVKAQWVRYAVDVGEGDGLVAETLSQQYQLKYGIERRIGDGRAGSYSLGLGYEYNVLNVDIGEEERSINTGKYLFRGKLSMAPGGLPFRLKVFSQDNFTTQFGESRSFLDRETILESGLPSDLRNGQYVVSGLTLLVGIRNGSYLGSYRDILSRYPRLLIDFKQVNRRDLKGATPTNSRLRDLAFVSLNKKDNWFHYRLRDYRNYLDSSEDYQEYTYTLGTIDPALIRKWVNLTNWIKLSVDGTYNVEIKEKVEALPVQSYHLNMFSVLSRAKTKATFLGYYTRRREGERLEKRVVLPLSVSGVWGADSDWSLRASGEDDKDSGVWGAESREKNIYLFAAANFFKRSAWNFSVQASAEQDKTLTSEGLSGRAVFLVKNKSSKGRDYLEGRYSVARFEGETLERETESLEHEVSGLWRRYSRNLEIGAEVDFLFSSGGADKSISSKISQNALDGLYLTDATIYAREDGVFHSKTNVYADYKIGDSLKTRGKMLYDFLEEGRQRKTQFVVEHALEMAGQGYILKLDQTYAVGDISVSNSVYDNSIASGTSLDKYSDLYQLGTSLAYRPNRSYEAKFSCFYEERTFAGGGKSSLELNQVGSYAHYTRNGVVRRLFDVEEELTYSWAETAHSVSSDVANVKFRGNYYPKQVWRLEARAEMTLTGWSPDIARYGASSTVTFAKLQMAGSYDHGQNFSSGEKRQVEDRWEVTIKKTF